MFKKFKTLIELLYNSKEATPTNTFLQYKENNEYINITYSQFVSMAENLSAALYDLGVKSYDKVGIISENMYKWLITDMALLFLGAVDVPRGSDSTPHELIYILKHADIKYCFVENVQQANKILILKKELPHLKHIILLTGDIADITEKVPLSIKIHHFDTLLEKGTDLYEKYREKLFDIKKSINENDIITIIYTSGTTGDPKGVMLKHKNIVHNIHVLPDIIDVIPGKERWLSILPVWHIFERTIEYIVMSTQGLMCYSKPTSRHLLPDFAFVKPTLMVSVPRIWEALYQGIINKIKNESKIKWHMFRFFSTIGHSYIKSKKTIKNLIPFFKKPPFIVHFLQKTLACINIALLFFWYILGDKLIFRKIREKTGGCLKLPISGGGALPEYIEYFFAAIKVELYEGYGLTETSPVLCVKTAGRLVSKTVGPPIPEVEMYIGDETGKPLDNQSEKGIVYVRGPNITSGYYKEEQKTKDVISNSGWFNTGDLGRMTITGELQLEGRAKDTIVLLGGENIEPAPIEERLLEAPLIHQVIIVGQDKKILGALIVPDEEALSDYATRHMIKFKSLNDLCKNKTIIDEYRKIIKSKINTRHGFRSYERITFITLIPKSFEPGKELTHSLKMKRNYILDLYKKEINAMYQ